MVFGVTVVLQTDVVGGGAGAYEGAAVLVRRDAGEDEEGEFEDSVWVLRQFLICLSFLAVGPSVRDMAQECSDVMLGGEVFQR